MNEVTLITHLLTAFFTSPASVSKGQVLVGKTDNADDWDGHHDLSEPRFTNMEEHSGTVMGSVRRSPVL